MSAGGRHRTAGGPLDRRPAATAAAALAVVAAVAAVLAAGGPTGGSPAPPNRPGGGSTRLELGPAPDISGFARATEDREFRLPFDHGPHYDYQSEWWYYTGHLADDDGRRYGFQLTVFRRGLSPGPPPGGPGLATNQVYFAHFALTDVAAGEHAFAERWSRGADGLAGARGDPFAVWLEDWRVDATSPDGRAVRLEAREGALRIALDLEARKSLVRHGDRGLSAKSEERGNASYYVGYTRLSARGELRTEEGERSVSGEAWFDHEWSTRALGAGAHGWDWFSLQLDDGRELMHFQIRHKDGTVEPVSGGTLVGGDGRTQRLPAAAVDLVVLDRWTSPHTGARYPARWRLRVPTAGLDLVVEPWVADQEMRTSFVYWEGAVRVSGSASGRPVGGNGYVELTGYARSMQGVF